MQPFEKCQQQGDRHASIGSCVSMVGDVSATRF